MKGRIGLLTLIIFVQIQLVQGQNNIYQAEGLPDKFVARMEVRDRFLSELPRSMAGMSPQFVITTLKRWIPGTTVHAAFNGGDNELRRTVANAAAVWLQNTTANITLDFGYSPADGSYRSWSAADRNYAAELRISFDQDGYWSLIGHDSDDPGISSPGEASMNFGGFLISLPPDYQTIVAHEFGHAFGFQHEHQSPVSGCDSQFHWFDDPGYQPTRAPSGGYVADAQQRRPGIYTVLGGPPNNWSASKVDFNIKQLPTSSAFTIGPFDIRSIMMYSFPDWMFVSPTSPCYTPENLTLSAQDKQGFAQAYPSLQPAISMQLTQRRGFLDAVLNSTVPAESKERFRILLNTLP